MKYFGQTEKSIIAECEKCNTTLKISKELCKDKGNNNYDVIEEIICDKCGNKSDRILKIKPVKKGLFGNIKEAVNEMNTHAANKKATEKAEAHEPVKCPKCGSTQITANKKGFGIGKAIVGDLVAGSVGLLAGDIGKNKVMITCLKCGHTWKAGE